MKICIVTCTGYRPELFSLCRKWVERQTIQANAWIVASDVNDPLSEAPSWATKVYVKESNSIDFVKKAHRALLAALKYVPKDHHAVIIEDDDWYPKNYLQVMSHYLNQGSQICGCLYDRRYNIPGRLWNADVPSAIADASKLKCNAGCTAINSSAIDKYIDLLNRSSNAESEAWEIMDGVKQNEALRVAIKGVGFGLPGRRGATSKHNPKFASMRKWNTDPNLSKLIEWIGDDAFSYVNLCENNFDEQ